MNSFTGFKLVLILFLCFSQVNAQPGALSIENQSLPAQEPAPNSTTATDMSHHRMSPIQEDLIRSGSGSASFKTIGTSYNILTTITVGQNQVSWSEELQSVIFVHRHNDGTPGGSGGLSFDISTDGGDSWSTNVSLSPDYNTGSFPNNQGNRYPSAVLYNPTGNTNPDAAYVAAAGPALDASSGLWGLVFRNSARSDGTSVLEDYSKEDPEYEYFPYGMTENADGSIWYISTIYNGTGNAANDSLNGAKYKLWKGVFNGSSNEFDWTKVATLRPDYFMFTGTSGVTNRYNTFNYNIAFSPDGQIGYAVIIGGALTGLSTGLSPKPIIYKSTDAGNSWNLLPDYNFASLPALGDFLIGSDQGEGPVLPYFTSVDVVVDQDGRLHIASEVNSRFSSSTDPDSLYFIYLANAQPVSALYHLTTTDGTDWTASTLDTVRLQNGSIPLAGSTPIRVGPGVQISRSQDGSKIFFTWSDSDINIVLFNDLPDVLGRGFDVSSGDYTFISNFTKSTGFEGVAFFPTLAPTINESGASHDYELPVVFAIPGADGGDPAQFIYVQGIGFNEGDFGLLAPPPVAGFTYTYPGYGGTVLFSNTSTNANNYIWDFGDGLPLSGLTNPSHTFPASGSYEVCLTAQNLGGDNTFCQEIDLLSVGIGQAQWAEQLLIGPNPTAHVLQIQSNQSTETLIQVYDMLGRLAMPAQRFSGSIELGVSDLPIGTYRLVLEQDNQVYSRSISILR